MKRKLIFLLSLLLSLQLCSCSNDEPVNREWIEIDYENPVRATPLLANYAQQYDGLTMWPSRVIDDSGLTEEAGDYSYWQEHKNEAQTTEELMAMCDIPKDKLQAMSTPNLARTCYRHPYAFVYTAQNVIYHGFFFMTRANCYRELMQRKTGAAELLNLYCELEYTANSSDFALNALTLFLMTAVDYNALNHEQLSRLSTEVFNKIDNIVATDGDNHIFSEKLRFPYLLGAFIAYHYDSVLSDDEVNKLKGFINAMGNNGPLTITAEDISRATLIISQSLERMATRAMDGNGKAFLEGGVLVDANLNFTQSQLQQALNNHEWETDYSFYYDNNTIASNKSNNGFILLFHTNRTVESSMFPSSSRIRDVAVSGKQIIITHEESPYSSATSFPLVITVVSLDMNDNGGRIIMDMKDFAELEGFDTSSLHLRMVMRTK